jgi:hypothetical protein
MNQSVLNELLQKTNPTPINTNFTLNTNINNETDVDAIYSPPSPIKQKQIETIKRQSTSIENYNKCKIIIPITIIIIIIFIINDYLILRYTNINLL